MTVKIRNEKRVKKVVSKKSEWEGSECRESVKREN